MSEEKTKSGAGELLKQASGFDGIEGETIATIAELLGGLLIQNWSQIKACRDRSDDSAVSISFSITVDSSAPQTLVSAKIGFSQKFTDAAEDIVDDPNQEKLPLETPATKKAKKIFKDAGVTIQIHQGKAELPKIGGAE